MLEPGSVTQVTKHGRTVRNELGKESRNGSNGSLFETFESLGSNESLINSFETWRV